MKIQKRFKYFYPATMLYIIVVVLTNTLFLWIPFLAVLGTTVTPADITAGSIYVFRDFAQREIKHYVFLAMIIASIISYFLANQNIALASFLAFSTAELIDWSIFTFTGKPLSQRLLLSAAISAPIDSAVFCAMVSSLHWLDFVLMTLAKITGVLLIWFTWKTRSYNVLNKTAKSPDRHCPA